MSVPSHTHQHPSALPWLSRAQRRWPTAWRLAFVALVAALSFVLAGPTTAAEAAAPPPPAAGDSSDGKKPNPWDWAYWKMHEFLNPDAHDTEPLSS
ncbi:hypothetical protein GPZ77_33810 [Streptomyces sp. QHH-9511]|uniref:hypothetical protein n=1 Tax=Streptomyces sp. QHH-9511 TaxID=2684468 RepID=UPI001316607E|nr:hypothetical protein [Streptomyces sp. QHH-9511]QGZ52614.1 hypothetical protein GPZ77_33810 [Streptomyces sp. QHH-9511]